MLSECNESVNVHEEKRKNKQKLCAAALCTKEMYNGDANQ